MQNNVGRQHLAKLGGMSAMLAGLTFFLTVLYLFGVLARAGLTIDMFDDHRSSLPWIAEHARLYSGMWLLYFVSQAFLLPVPWVVHEWLKAERRVSALTHVGVVMGTSAVIMAMIGLVIMYTTSPIVGRAYVAAASPVEQANVLLVSDLFADVGKEIRLFSEVFLGLWLGITGLIFVRHRRSRMVSWVVGAIGGYTVFVAVLKIVDPFTPLEDSLGFFLAIAYCGLGLSLIRGGSHGHTFGTEVTTVTRAS